jgi:hypothetical protein
MKPRVPTSVSRRKKIPMASVAFDTSIIFFFRLYFLAVENIESIGISA